MFLPRDIWMHFAKPQQTGIMFPGKLSTFYYNAVVNLILVINSITHGSRSEILRMKQKKFKLRHFYNVWLILGATSRYEYNLYSTILRADESFYEVLWIIKSHTCISYLAYAKHWDYTGIVSVFELVENLHCCFLYAWDSKH